MFNFLKPKYNKNTIKFDYINNDYNSILNHENSFAIDNKSSFEKDQFNRALIKPHLRENYIFEANKLLKMNNLDIDINIPLDISLRDELDAIENYGLIYIQKNNIEKAYKIAEILFNQPSSYKHFMSSHFYFNHFMQFFYKFRSDSEVNDKLINIGKFDFAITNRYKMIQDVILPCITKLVQMLESEKKYKDALFIIDIYKKNGYTKHYQNELYPKEVRIKKKSSKEDN